MKLFSYTMYVDGENTVGIVQAKNIFHAKQILREAYDEWDEAETEVQEVEYESDGICEIYYG